MTPRYSFTQASRTWAGRARWTRVRARLGRLCLHPSFRGRRRDRRKLAVIERALVTDSPGLSSLFAVFNQLNRGEEAAGVERVPPPAWPRPRLAYVAVLLALAAIVALCLTLATQIRPVMRPCLPAAAVGSSAYVPVHGSACAAYANTPKQ